MDVVVAPVPALERSHPSRTSLRTAGSWILAWRGGRGSPWINLFLCLAYILKKLFSFKPKSSGFQKNLFFFFFLNGKIQLEDSFLRCV